MTHVELQPDLLPLLGRTENVCYTIPKLKNILSKCFI